MPRTRGCVPDGWKCVHPTKAGKPCSAAHYADGYCRWHHPDLEAQRQAERIAGGKAKASSVRARKKVLGGGMDLAEIDAALCTALLNVLSGELEPGIATAAASVARTVSAIRAASDLEQRLSALEARAHAQEKEWTG